MRILILSQFFYPEMGAPAARFFDFAKYFIRHGHQVAVLTGFPNFPSGVIHEGYQGKRFMEEEVEGIQVYRTWLYTSSKLSFASKSLGYATFTLSSVVTALRKLPQFDAMVATAPPPTIGASALAISKALKVPYVYDLRDLWPEAIVNSGRLKNPLLIRSFEALNRRAYNQAFAITTVSEGKKDALVEQGVPADTVHVIPNGVDLHYFDQAARDQEALAAKTLAENGVPDDRFTITYAGIMNPPQGLSILIEAARELENTEPHLHFVLIGSGSCRDELMAASEDLANVSFIREQPRENIPAFLSLSDVNVVPLRPRKDSHTVPSKIFEYMASGRPLLLSADGEPARLLRESRGGLHSPAGDRKRLLRNIRRLSLDTPLRTESGRNARRYVEAEYNRQELNRRFMALLTSVVDEPTS